MPSKEGSHTLAEVVDAIRARAREAGGLPSWFGWGTSNVWAVQGEPWTEVIPLCRSQMYLALTSSAGYAPLRL